MRRVLVVGLVIVAFVFIATSCSSAEPVPTPEASVWGTGVWDGATWR